MFYNFSLHSYHRLFSVFAAFGLCIYMTSFFLLDSSQQKTIFYLLVAMPGIFLCVDLKSLFFSRPWAVSSLFFFLAYMVLSSFWSGKGDDALIDSLKYSLMVILLLLSILSFSRHKDGEFFLTLVLVLGGCLCAFSFFMIFKNEYSFTSLVAGRWSLQRINGLGEDNPITSAVICGLPVLAAWWRFPQSRWPVRFALSALIFLCFVLMFLTKSRGPILALIAAIVMLCVFRRAREDLALLVVFVLVGVLLIPLFDILSVIIDRAGSPNYRSEIWQGSIRLISENLFFGQGFGSTADIAYSGSIATHSHSFFLEILRVGGFFGGAIFCVMLFAFIGKPFGGRKEGFFILWLLYGLICLSSNGRLPLIRPSVEWFSLWIPLFCILFFRSGRNSGFLSGWVEAVRSNK